MGIVTTCPRANAQAGAAAVVINEVLASNGHTMTDPQGEYDDWIELYNRGNAPVNLGGMYLTDDPAEPTKWQFPKNSAAQTTIPAHGYLLVWADNEVGDAGLHAAFKLSAGGESVALFDQDGMTLIDSVTFDAQRTDISYGRFPDAVDTWSALTFPTPGMQNFRVYQGFVEKPQFSVPHGFYEQRNPSLRSPARRRGDDLLHDRWLGALPGGSPQARHDRGRLHGPVRITKTTCLRATAIKTGWYPSPIETSTYLFVADVITQSPTGAKPGPAWPSSGVNGQTIDYGMDPDVVNDPRYKNLMDDALLAIPSISLVTDLANLFDPQTGIYVNARSQGQAWERPVSVELIYPDGTEGFQIDAGLRIRGGYSRSGGNPKHAFRLFFGPDMATPRSSTRSSATEGVDEFEASICGPARTTPGATKAATATATTPSCARSSPGTRSATWASPIREAATIISTSTASTGAFSRPRSGRRHPTPSRTSAGTRRTTTWSSPGPATAATTSRPPTARWTPGACSGMRPDRASTTMRPITASRA